MIERNLLMPAKPLSHLTRRVLPAILAFVVLVSCSEALSPVTNPNPGEKTTASVLPSPHVHGVGINPKDDTVFLASHDGLFRYGMTGPQRVGPVMDVMGFTIAGSDHFYASGHPGIGTDLRNPMGLLESIDGGATWTSLSRQGTSDFHQLNFSETGILGFDGTLMRTTNGTAWDEVSQGQFDQGNPPYSLATSPDGSTILATTATGLSRSTDQGRTFKPLNTQVPMLFLVWARSNHIVGVTPAGNIFTSDDAGSTWTEQGTVNATPLAITAGTDKTNPRIVVVTNAGLVQSLDGGDTFTPLPMNPGTPVPDRAQEITTTT